MPWKKISTAHRCAALIRGELFGGIAFLELTNGALSVLGLEAWETWKLVTSAECISRDRLLSFSLQLTAASVQCTVDRVVLKGSAQQGLAHFVVCRRTGCGVHRGTMSVSSNS